MRHSDSATQCLFSPLGEAVGRGGFYLFPFSKNFQIVPPSLKYLSPGVRISSGVAKIRQLAGDTLKIFWHKIGKNLKLGFMAIRLLVI